jgi:hypothetical protein
VTVAARPRTAVEPAGGGPRDRTGRRTVARLAGLLTALAAGGTLIALPSAAPGPPREPETLTVDQVWPTARPVDIPGDLPDGPAYNPVFFIDTRVSLGTAPSPNGTHLRLVLRSADGALRELRRLPIAGNPQYGGFTMSGDEVAWAESTTDDNGKGRTEMWLADLKSDLPPRRLATDTGDVVFFNSRYDMLINGGRLYWAAVAPTEQAATEVRSVALTGGRVSVRTEPGAWALSAWPWLVSAGSGQSGPVQLRNPDARKLIEVDTTSTELATCSPVWCRVLVLAGEGPTRIDVMRPDGGDRQRMAGGTASAAVTDVALLDRFEVLSLASPTNTAVGTQQLLLYDVTRKRGVLVADGVGAVQCRGGVLWWSTGDDENLAWHALDLRTLT